MINALCYDRERRLLYKGVGDSHDSIFTEYDKKGYKTVKIAIPDEPVEIMISSNLHYQGASFLYAKILVKGKCLLNFRDIQALYILNNCELDTFQVSSGNWDELFDIIINNYNNLYITSEGEIENYLKELEGIIMSENISVFRNKTCNKPTKWNDTFLVMLHSIDIISNIIECKSYSVIEGNEFFEKRLLTTCKRFMKRFADLYSTWNLKEGDPRLKRFSNKLLGVCQYIGKYGQPFEYVDLLVVNKKAVSH